MWLAYIGWVIACLGLLIAVIVAVALFGWFWWIGVVARIQINAGMKTTMTIIEETWVDGKLSRTSMTLKQSQEAEETNGATC